MSPVKASPTRLRRREQGSAFILVLMALVVLTILGLGLALITQTEYQLGANDRSINRTFYAADSGGSVGLTYVMVNHDRTPRTVLMNDKRTVGGGSTQSQSVLSPYAPIGAAPCNLCSVSTPSQTYGAGNLYNSQNVVTAYGSYATTSSSGASSAAAQRNAFFWLDVQPFVMTADDIKMATYDAAQAQKVKF
jgi:hypothetical protein